MAQTMRVLGLRELGLRLKELGADVAGKVARATTNAGAQVIKKAAIVKAPVAPEPYDIEGVLVQPGNIGRNIVVKRVPPSQTNLTSEHLVTVRGKRKYGFASRVASLQEFGTVRQSPQAFVRPAFEENKSAAVDAMKNRLTARIKKAEKAGGGGGGA